MFHRQTETENSALSPRLPYYTSQYHINIFALVCTMAYSNKKIPQQDKTKTNYKCASTTTRKENTDTLGNNFNRKLLTKYDKKKAKLENKKSRKQLCLHPEINIRVTLTNCRNYHSKCTRSRILS